MWEAVLMLPASKVYTIGAISNGGTRMTLGDRLQVTDACSTLVRMHIYAYEPSRYPHEETTVFPYTTLSGGESVRMTPIEATAACHPDICANPDIQRRVFR